MVRLEIKRSIHSPGMDLSATRISNHTMLMDAVHDDQRLLSRMAWKSYTESGRGALYVDRENWMEIIKSQVERERSSFPCVYVPRGQSAPHIHLAELGPGYDDLLESYDPEAEFVLVVQHRKGDFIGAYWVAPRIEPRKAAEEE